MGRSGLPLNALFAHQNQSVKRLGFEIQSWTFWSSAGTRFQLSSSRIKPMQVQSSFATALQ